MLASTGSHVGERLYIADLGVGRVRPVFEPARDVAAAVVVQREGPEPHVHQRAAGNALHHSVDHHPVDGALHYSRTQPRPARELRQSHGARARQRGVHRGHLFPQTLRLFFDSAYFDFGPEVVAAGDKAGLFEAPHDDGCRLRIDAPQRRERTGRDVDPSTALHPGERRKERGDLTLPCRAKRNQPLAPAEVGAAIQHDALGSLPVPARAARLLDVRREAPRDARMDDEPDVRLVHAHPERYGRDDHGELVCHEPLLNVGPVSRAHPGVIRSGVDPGTAQAGGQFLALLARRGVDDSRRWRNAYYVEYAGQFVLLLLRREYPVGQVRAIEARHNHFGRAHLQGVQDILPHARGRRSRKREDWRVTEVPYGSGQEQVVRAEVVTPLRDAVGLVYDEETDAGTPQREDELQGPEAFGGHVEHLHLPRADPPLDLPALFRREPGVERGRIGDRALKQGVDLIFHQRDQGRDDHRQALLHQRGHLVTQALAAASGHHRERVPAFQNGPYGLLLARPERIEAEDLL